MVKSLVKLLLATGILAAQPVTEGTIQNLLGQDQKDGAWAWETANEIQALSFNDPQAALVYGNELMEISIRSGSNEFLLAGYYIMAMINHNLSADKEMLKYALKADSLSEYSGDDYIELTVKLLLGLAYNDVNQPKNALNIFKHVLSMVKTERDSSKLPDIYSNMASSYQDLGQYEASSQYYIRAVDIYKNSEDDYSNQLSAVYNNMAILFRDWEKNEEAIEYYLRAIQLNEANGSKVNLEMNYNNLAVAYKEVEQFDKAESYFLKSNALAQELGNKSSIARNLLNLGNMYSNTGKFQLAADSYRKSRVLCEELGIQYGILLNYYNLYDMYFNDTPDFDLAISYLDSAEAIVKTMNSLKWELNIHYAKAEAYALKSDYKKAYHHQSQYYQLKDSLFTSESQMQINELQTKYETVIKERENQQLKAANEIHELTISRQKNLVIAAFTVAVLFSALLVLIFILNRRKIQTMNALQEKNRVIEEHSRLLQESDSMKELLLDIIAHDLRNPISVVLSSSELLLESHPGDEMAGIINSGSHKLLDVIQNVILLSKAATDSEIPRENVNLEAMIRETLVEFNRSLEDSDIEIRFNFEGNMNILANPLLGEVFKNYLSNAIKYASDGKSFDISAVRNDGEITACVADFGNTIPEQDRTNIFMRSYQLEQGNDRGHGLGLAIVARIAVAHGGKAWVEPNTPNGNRFCLQIPVS